MAITLLQTKNGQTGSTSWTNTWNSAPTANDFGIVGLIHSTNPGAYTPPSGWTQIDITRSSTGGADACWASLWWKLNSTAAPAWSWANAAQGTAVAIEYSGTDLSSPIDITGTTATGNSGTPATNSITTTKAGDVVIAFYAQTVATGVPAQSFSSPTNSYVIEVQATNSDGNFANCCGALVDLAQGSAGNTSTGITSNRNDSWIAFITSITPPNAQFSNPRLSSAYFFYREPHPAELFE